MIHFDRTPAIEPLERTARWRGGDPPESYPNGMWCRRMASLYRHMCPSTFVGPSALRPTCDAVRTEPVTPSPLYAGERAET